jgi:hypothetical protein
MELAGLEVRVSLASNISFFAERVVKPTDNSSGQPLCDFAGQLILVERSARNRAQLRFSRCTCGMAMNPASAFKMRTVDPNSSYRETHKQEDAEPKCRPISLLSFLEAENIRLRQAIVELSRDAKTLKEALDKMEARPGRGRFYRPHTGPAKAVVTPGECESAARPPLRTRSADQPTN